MHAGLINKIRQKMMTKALNKDRFFKLLFINLFDLLRQLKFEFYI